MLNLKFGRKATFALAALLMTAVFSPASALTVSAFQTVDLTQEVNLNSIQANLDTPSLISVPGASISFPKSPPDRVELTVDYKDNQTLRITNGNLFFGLNVLGSSRNGTLGNVSISFTDFSTNSGLASPVINVGSKTVPNTSSFGPSLNIFDLGLAGDPSFFIEFSGFTLAYDLIIVNTGFLSLETRFVTTGQTQIGTASAGTSVVPVPAALPLFSTGLAIMGFVGWRRKRIASV